MLYNNIKRSRKDQTMSTTTTTREYLRTNGYPVGARGRFSAAQKQAIQEAIQKGVEFSDKKNSK